ncbi:hypothetical protein SteCoe_24338 [Stentor coeruleus]|uniref:MORN repeat-containing protein n=1 Tax=Stentor coeruleus TaxID=5963 RepID=A0A1R2BHR8_9CILI|nr:hypothetical protein SteCoe_24338 [Stentor coeruleus]
MSVPNSESSRNRNSTTQFGVSVLFDMNSDILLDPVDTMYSKLGRYEVDFEPNEKMSHNDYIVLEGGFYTGFTYKGQPEGYGCLMLTTGQVYEGYFHKGSIEGLGRLIDLDGTAYEGQWKRNDIKSIGTIQWLDGRIYEGQIKKIKPHGEGVMTYPGHSKYDGMFRKGHMNGYGIMYWDDGKIYAGTWKSSKMHGFGAMHWKNKYYFGTFCNNIIESIGRMEWKDGGIYVGQWSENKRHGLGTQTGEGRKSGKWFKDQFTEDLKELGEFRPEIIEVELKKQADELRKDKKIKDFIDFRMYATRKSDDISDNIAIEALFAHKVSMSEKGIGDDNAESESSKFYGSDLESIHNFKEKNIGMIKEETEGASQSYENSQKMVLIGKPKNKKENQILYEKNNESMSESSLEIAVPKLVMQELEESYKTESEYESSFAINNPIVIISENVSEESFKMETDANKKSKQSKDENSENSIKIKSPSKKKPPSSKSSSKKRESSSSSSERNHSSSKNSKIKQLESPEISEDSFTSESIKIKQPELSFSYEKDSNKGKKNRKSSSSSNESKKSQESFSEQSKPSIKQSPESKKKNLFIDLNKANAGLEFKVPEREINRRSIDDVEIQSITDSEAPIKISIPAFKQPDDPGYNNEHNKSISNSFSSCDDEMNSQGNIFGGESEYSIKVPLIRSPQDSNKAPSSIYSNEAYMIPAAELETPNFSNTKRHIIPSKRSSDSDKAERFQIKSVTALPKLNPTSEENSKNWRTSSESLFENSNINDREQKIVIPKFNPPDVSFSESDKSIHSKDDHSDDEEEKIPFLNFVASPPEELVPMVHEMEPPSNRISKISQDISFDENKKKLKTEESKLLEPGEILDNWESNKSLSIIKENPGINMRKFKESQIPGNFDVNTLIKAKEQELRTEPAQKGRLEKVLVVNSSKNEKKAPLSTMITSMSQENDYAYLQSPAERPDLVDENIIELPETQRIEKLQNFDFPCDQEGFQTLIEMRELIGPFDYESNEQPRGKLLFTDWIEVNNMLYIGEMDKYGLRQGRGVEILPYCIYEGYWLNSQRSGLGRVITINGDNFEGFWTHDIKRGFGALWSASGTGYVGDWDSDVPEGKGIEVSTLEIYEGDFHVGQRHGKGLLTQANLTYTGEFFTGQIHGYGVVKWSNNSAYAGIFINGESKGLKGAFIPAYVKKAYKPRSLVKVKRFTEQNVPPPSRAELSVDESEIVEKITKRIFDSEKPQDTNEEMNNSDDGKEKENNEELPPLFSRDLKTPDSAGKDSGNFRNDFLSFANLNKEPKDGGTDGESPIMPLFGRELPNKSGAINDLKNSFNSGNSEKVNESDVSQGHFGQRDMKKGILRTDAVKRNDNIRFPKDLPDFDEDVLLQRKLKFKNANKEKGVENILKQGGKKK